MWGLGAHYLCHVNEIKRMYIILGILLICYMIYGIAHAVKNRSLTRFEKSVWIIIILCMPVLGASLYLRSTFRTRD
jgi:hypothetical protein